jgi:tetratricopeptide (TPR) repeat protein
MLTFGCSRWDADSAAPLPPFPSGKEKQGPFLIATTRQRLEALGNTAPSTAWKRLAWIYLKQGNSLAAQQALDQALTLVNQSDFSPAQEVVERSNLADYYLLLEQPERARAALADFRYQGVSTKGKALLRRTTLTALEQTRLEGSEPFTAPRLVLALRDQGPEEALKKALLPRLEFALKRGPQGGREDYFHGAIVLEFHLGSAATALAATQHQSPSERVRTLSSLHWGGTIRPSTILFMGEGLPQWHPSESLRPQIRTRLLEALKTLPPSTLQDLEISSGAILAALQGDFELAEHFAHKLYEPQYRREALDAIGQHQPPLFSYHPDSRTSNKADAFAHRSLLNQNLSRLVGIRDAPYQQRLLAQFLKELRNGSESKLFASILSNLIWTHKRLDLLAQLETLHDDPAFHCSQQLLHAEAALTKGDANLARQHLAQMIQQLPRIAKPSHRFYQGLMAQEVARRLNDKTILVQLQKDLTSTLPSVQIMTLRNDGIIRLAGLSFLCGKLTDYNQQVAMIKGQTSASHVEVFSRIDALERLAREQARLGKTAEALQSIAHIGIASYQISGLLTITEQHLKTSPQPSFVTTPSLQAGLGTGRGSGQGLSMTGR